MQDQTTHEAALLTAFAQPPSFTAAPVLPEVGWWPLWNIATLELEKAPAERPHRGRLGRFARTAARHPLSTGRTCLHAAKMLPTVRHALPWYVWPIVGLAAVVKCLPVDFGADETLFAIAFALILWQRPGLLEALYHEAQAGKPARCQCGKHTRKAARS